IFGLTITAISFRRYLAVGTGSTAPDVTDDVLDNEVQRANSDGGFGIGANSAGLDDTLDLWWYESLVRRVVTMSDDRNLTEYGFSAAASVAINIRELLRDELGDPITVSLLTGKSLRVDHTIRVEMPAP